MLVVSDTTTITNLLRIDLLSLIQKLYNQIYIPQAVYDELSRMPSQKKQIDKLRWIKVKMVTDQKMVSTLLEKLDAGESEAIALAVEMKADILIIDEWFGRNIAESYGLNIIGLFGILLGAKRRGYIKAVKPYMDDLIKSYGFRVSEALYIKVLRLAGE